MRPHPIVAAILLVLPASAWAEERPRSLCVFCEDGPAGGEGRAPSTRRRFEEAAAGVAALEVLPWAFDRYALHEDFAHISIATVRRNFRTGFEFDHDDFPTNQFQHPYHGGLFFNAARANGYGFWASGLFAMAGSLGWECCMENTAPSINDLVNTTLGGMALGEITHRLATVVRDNQAEGSRRLWREAAATLIDPVGGVERLVHGDWTRRSPNPDERYPRGFAVAAELGYRGITAGNRNRDRALLTLSAAYGDPFSGAIAKPYDTFWLEADLSVPAEVITRVEGRGILKGRELTEADAPLRTILAAWQQYEYFHNESQVFGAQAVSLGLLSRAVVGRAVATADVAASLYPLAGIQTREPSATTDGSTYDYAPGAGVRAGVRLDGPSAGAALSYGVAWLRTVNGASDESTLQFLRLSATAPVKGRFGVGGGWTWYSRVTSYSGGFVEGRRTQTEWRVFASWKLGRSIHPEPKTPLPQ